MDEAQITKINGQYVAYHGTDDNLFVTFEMEAMQDEEKTAQEGRPIFFDIPFITIRIAGDKTSVVKRPVKPEDKERFARHWERFERQEHTALEGTPIEQWPLVTKAQALELKAMNIMSVEMLAGVSDANLKWPMARDLREKAIKWLESAKEGAVASKWDKKEKEMQSEIDTLRGELEELKSLLSEQPKKAGRPKKVVNG